MCAHWGISMMAALKSLAQYSNISVISVLATCLFLFSMRSSWLLKKQVIFLLKSGYFRHYVFRPWILVKLPVLPGFLWHHFSRGGGMGVGITTSLLRGIQRRHCPGHSPMFMLLFDVYVTILIRETRICVLKDLIQSEIPPESPS